MSVSTRYLALVLGLLSCIGPLSIDMYLPALPAIETDLNADTSAVQMTLTAYFMGFGISQLFYGPLSDQIGRKKPLYIGLTIFIISSIGCFLAPTIEWLTIMRFAQGLGGAVVMVIPRAIIRDTQTGVAATRMMGMVMMVISISPMLAPLAGSAVLAFGGWHYIFALLAVLAVFSVLLTSFGLPETLHETDKVKFNIGNFVKGSRILLTDGYFMGLTLIGGFALASFFVFIASASFVYTGQFGLSPAGFGLAFALNGFGFFLATRLAAPISERIGTERMIRLAVAGSAAVTLALLALCFAGLGTLTVIVSFLFVSTACLGLVIPSTMVLALDKHGHIAGLASSLGGTIQMFVGGAMIAVASPFFNGTATPMIGAIALCSVFTLLLALRTLPSSSATVLATEE